MATYYVWSGASGTNAGTSWTNAYTAFGSAVTAATSAGDIIKVHYTHQEELAADTTYTFGADNIKIISVNKDSSDAATLMGTGGWIGNSTTNRGITLAGADRTVRFYGITFRTAGSTADVITVANTAGADHTFESCYFWNGNTATSGNIRCGGGSLNFCKFVDCTFRFGATQQGLLINGSAEFVGGTISGAGSTPTTLIQASNSGAQARFCGTDLSLVTGTLIANDGSPSTFHFDRCKLGSGVTILAAQTSNPTRASASALVTDCDSGDAHGLFGYYNAMGSMTSDTGIYFTSGAAAQSWKIVTTANAARSSPFVTPWVELQWDGTSAITPYVEALRDGSATAYTDAELWVEISAKVTSGFTTATFFDDRQTVAAFFNNDAGTAQADGAGLGSWTGESGTAKSMKLALGSTITPAESGPLSARVHFAAVSSTVYIDPFVRT